MPVESIAVIPCAELWHLVCMAEVVCELLDFFRRKSERRRIFHLQNAVHRKIIQIRENALFRDAQHACQHSEVQRRIRLERRREKGAEEIDGLVIKVMFPCRLDRHVIFVQEQDGLFPIMRLEHAQEHGECRLQIFKWCFPAIHGSEHVTIFRVNAVAFAKNGLFARHLLQSIDDHRLHRRPVERFPSAQRQEEHRARPHLRHHRRILRDREAVKQSPMFFRAFDIEEIP